MHRPIAGLLASLLACAAVPAAGAPDGEALVRGFIDDVETLSARFEQTLVDADDSILEESSGTLHIRRPGRFRWTYQEPWVQVLVADGVNVWSYDSDLEQVTVKAQAEVLGSTPALLLGGAGDALAEFEVTEAAEDRGTSWVRLRPTASDSSFESVDLGFTEDGQLSRMIFIDTLGQSTLVALFDVVVNEPVADAHFEFEVPDGADLVGTPLPRPEP